MGNDLAQYIQETYRKYRENRQTLEAKWQRNIDAFRSITTEIWKAGEGEDWRSDTFCDYTRQKCLAGYALIINMILAGGKLPFMLKLSPWSSVEYDVQDEEVKNAVDKLIEQMKSLIEQQLSDANVDRQTMKTTMSGSIYGEGWLKKYVYEKINKYYAEDNSGWGVVEEGKMQPGHQFISIWDIFRDLENDDLKECAGIIHRQMVSAYWLRQRKGQPGSLYIDSEIETVLLEYTSNIQAVDNSNIQPAQRDIAHRKNELECLEFWGRVPRSIVENFLNDESGISTTAYSEIDNGDEIEVMACVVGEHVVRFTISTPDERPFHRFVWEIALDEIGANGVADNVEPFQKIINGIVRNMEDNLRLSGNVMIATKERWIDRDQIEFKPGANIPIADECDDVRKAIQPVVIPDVTGGIANFFTMIERVLDESSGIPKIAQGMAPVGNRTGTATEINQQLEKSGQGMASVIRNFDEGIIEPVIADYYHYNMMDPDCGCKGNFIVQALGFTSFQARVERINKLLQLLNLFISSPVLSNLVKLRELIVEIVKASDIDPDQILKTIDELAEEAKQPNPERDLTLAEREAEVQRKQAETQARKAGILFDKEKLRLEQARLSGVASPGIPTNPLDIGSENRSTNQGPYIERGMESNNLQQGILTGT